MRRAPAGVNHVRETRQNSLRETRQPARSSGSAVSSV
jgi:hypothetical protein